MKLRALLSKFGAMPAQEKQLLLAAVAALPAAWIGLRVLGLARMQSWLGRAMKQPAVRATPQEVARWSSLVKAAAKHALFPSTCLTRSLVLVWLLKRRGVASNLRIGVRLTSGVLDAHAWVEYQGAPVNERADLEEVFAVFDQPLPLKAFPSP